LTAINKVDEIAQILNIKELQDMARIIISIPDFNNEKTINVRVQKPRLMAMAAKGQIPNHLIGIATEVVGGKQKNSKKDDELLKDAALMMELYCQACLVDPTYEEFKDIMTDQQADYIFRWATNQVKELDSFREESRDSSNDDNGKKVQKVTK